MTCIEFMVHSIIDIVEFVRVSTQRSELFMGMTVMASTDTFFDMCITASLAAGGYEVMAVTGLFAGQMFNFLVGFGISCVIKYLGPSPYKKFNLYEWGNMETDKEGQMSFYLVLWMIGIISYLIFKIWWNK